MRQAERKKGKDKIAIALMLCFCVIALTSIFTIRANINKINESGSNVPVSDSTPSAPAEPNTPTEEESVQDAAGNIPAVDSLDGSEAETPPPSSSSDYGNPRFSRPLNTSEVLVSNEYSMNALVYSVTLDQYMTHCGVDLEAEADTQVLAIANGVVTAVYHDDRYGNSVEINHGEGYTAVYSNLSDANMVEAGDEIQAGQIIGGVGTTGLFESLEPAHLHLELLHQGSWVNPMDYITIG